MGFYKPHEIEQEISKFWDKKNVPERIVELNPKRAKFYLLDGPPYVNGVPHVGHAKTTVFKDVWGKFKFMQGFSVWFQPGFDCGGLPIENKVEKEMGIKAKSDIEEKIGVDKFIEECKKFAKGNESVWLSFYKNIAAWRGWVDPYLTSENYYLESGWWTIKRWFESGLFVEGHRPGFWCPHCETVLAGIEASESYKNVEDPSIIIKFRVANTKEYLLVFTTTPWTLPANAAIAVHPDEIYVKVKADNETFIIAEKRLVELDRIGLTYKIQERIPGKKLGGLKYEPIMETGSQKEIGKNTNAHHVILSIPVMKKRVASKAMIKGNVQGEEEFGHVVTMDVGTGLVHIAPGHGEVDNRLGKHYNLPEVSPVDEKGKLTADAGKYAGLFVKKADPLIIEDLRSDGKILDAGKLVHSYPLCWRCKTPLIYRMSRQWFLKLDTLRDKIIKANKDVRWLPEFARERYYAVIKEAPDWAVTRQRYWGIPLPIWTCECGSKKVIGSSEELRKLSTKKLPPTFDLHKNFVDKVKIKCECGLEMQREKDIMDVWFDSGIAPWASLGYPFKNKELFNKLWNVDLVDESQDQVRAWFHTLMICGIATFDEAPFKTVCLNGWTLDEKGEKMSKSLGNVVDAKDAYIKLGADLLRLYICCDIAPWDTQRFSSKTAEELGRSLNVLWNSFEFAKSYCSKKPEKINPGMLRPEDKWLISKTNSLIETVTKNIDTFQFHLAGRGLVDFILNDLSRWYIKLVRDRVSPWYSGGDKDSASYAINYALENAVKLLAPLAPFISEKIWQELGGKDSVHLCAWPKPDAKLVDKDLESKMEISKKLSEAINAARQAAGIKLRWPVSAIWIEPNDKQTEQAVAELSGILKNMGNADDVKIFKKSKIPQSRPESKIKWADSELGRIGIGDVLKDEAVIRELTRQIQVLRKESGLSVTDTISLWLQSDEQTQSLLNSKKADIIEAVGAKTLAIGQMKNRKGQLSFENIKVDIGFNDNK